ncbi:calpain-B-like isoform X2 [Mytilus trossulus]|uniref:calpain-B-like isoform X2 n=1 Tax=Mytilus trossulus TaxID=6551 RepID=UPI0030066EFE
MSLPRGLVRQEDYLGLKSELLRNNKLFVDPDFSPGTSSLTFSGAQPRISGVRSVIWKRPRDLVVNPRFVKAGLSRHDLYQGVLGNCWFIAGAAVVSTIPKLLFRCVPIDQDFDRDYAGLFRFNFWWYGKWVEVIVDDLLPTDGMQLIYARNRSDPDEFWPALLEKAYAKLRGNYEALDGGKLQDAIVDMTGSISEYIDLKDKSKIQNNLYDLVWKSYQMNSLMGASIHLPENAKTPEVEMNNGLFMGHAYSITGIASVPYRGNNVQLLRLRNPWGRSEWKGDWSDHSDEIRNISQEARTKLGIVITDDGEFWIPFIDVLRNFDEIQLCHLQPDSLTSEIANDERKQNWEVTVYHDAWIRGLTAGGCGNHPYQDLYWKNPQFFVTLKDVDITDSSGLCTLIATLTEKEMNNKSTVAIGFDVYKLREFQRRPLDGESAPRNALILRKRSGIYEYNREVTRRFELDPGVYALIPSTFKAHDEAKFMLRLYTEKPADSGLLEEDDKNELPKPVKPLDPVKELFMKHATEDGHIYAKELKHFLRELSASEFGESILFSLEAARSLVTLMDRNRSGALNYDEVVKGWNEIKAYKKIFEQFDKDGTASVDTYELSKLFSALGFTVNRQVQIAIVRRYGNRNNKIRLTDFLIVIFKLTLMFELFKDQQLKTGGNNDAASFTLNEYLYYTMYC